MVEETFKSFPNLFFSTESSNVTMLLCTWLPGNSNLTHALQRARGMVLWFLWLINYYISMISIIYVGGK